MTAVRPETRPGGLGAAGTSRVRAGSRRVSAHPRPSRRPSPSPGLPRPPRLLTGRRSPDPSRRRPLVLPHRCRRPPVPPHRYRHPPVPPHRYRHPPVPPHPRRLRRCLIPRPSPTTRPRWAGTRARRRQALSPARPPRPGAAFPACPDPVSPGPESPGLARQDPGNQGLASPAPESQPDSAAARCPGAAAAR